MFAAILSLACRYPDAPTPDALWKNVLEGRRSFRILPDERIDLARYAASLVGEADSITPVKAGLLTDWRFDPEKFLIPRSTFETADLAHWLALEVAAEAVERAGGIEQFDRERTAVVVANTLTGEFSRASMLRLRLPFLDEILARAAADAALDSSTSNRIRTSFAKLMRDRFPPPQGDTLSGGLANTIAGRIANYFDLRGGAYTVDGACASSLVALANAADLLSLGHADAVIVGAVDLSLDPFELVGFSRNGVLARDDMRVFDERSSGFWPGEGAGFALLMRESDARRRALPVQARLRGWGIATDGAGGFTRPAVAGQLLAMRRAYLAADVDPADLGYVEAHGTGTAVGDPVEVQALAAIRNGAARSLPIGSIKTNIGHTKAAAGFAGLIKAVKTLESGIVPPHVGCVAPHPVFRAVEDRVRPALRPELLPAEKAALAGVSSFGFGGINAHVVLEHNQEPRLSVVVPRAPRPLDAELFVFGAERPEDIHSQLLGLQRRAATISCSELTDAAAKSVSDVGTGELRAAVVAGSAEELDRKLARAAGAVGQAKEIVDFDDGVFVVRHQEPAKIGFLFPGQSAPSRVRGGLWSRCFDEVPALIAELTDGGDDPSNTAIAQPAIAAASLAGWRILRDFGIEPAIAAGHSLGELMALVAGGSIGQDAVVRLAALRGATLATHAHQGGAMLRIAASLDRVRELIGDLGLALACDNGPSETAVSGNAEAISLAEERADRLGLASTRLRVSHAFHSPMMAPALVPFASVLSGFPLRPVQGNVFSTVLGRLLEPADDLHDLLVRQLVAPVQFAAALRHLADKNDLLIEVGPGFGLTRLARAAGCRATSIDAFGDSVAPLLSATGAAFAHGVPVKLDRLFGDRAIRSIDLAARPVFLASPCGRHGEYSAPSSLLAEDSEPKGNETAQAELTIEQDVLALVRSAIAAQTGFDPNSIGDDLRFLDHLHLNSISVARLVTSLSQSLGIKAPNLPTEFANATARELAAGLMALRSLAPAKDRSSERLPSVRPWVRTFALHWAERQDVDCLRQSVRWKAVAIGSSEEDHRLVATRLNDIEAPDGLLVWLASNVDDTSAGALLSQIQSGWKDPSIHHLTICHAGAPVAAFARSIAIEARFESVAVLERPLDPVSPELIVDQLARMPSGFSEIRIDSHGRRFEPEFRPTPAVFQPRAVLDSHDVVLVTGGAKGIGAECALRIATRAGVGLVLVGRSPHSDHDVVATLERAKAAGVRCKYLAVDVTDPARLAEAVSSAMDEVGPITALLHAAGMNDPTLFTDITDEKLHDVMAPKTIGLRAAIAAAGAKLRRIVTFGSILGRMGLKGEAHYALANAWQSAIAEEISHLRSDCDVLSLEWSIWNGAGMGHRLGSLERLARFGVDAIALDDGLASVERLVLGGAIGTMMVTSRFGPPREVTLEQVSLPLHRFIEKPLVHYPRLELVIETTLSLGRDPYLADHRIAGMSVLPGVLGLEAMAQVAAALVGHIPVAIKSVSFTKAVVLPDSSALRIQILALAEEDGTVEAVIRAEDDDFASDRMRASFEFTRSPLPSGRDPIIGPVDVDGRSLYGLLFFQDGRFRRISRYNVVSARRISATLSRQGQQAWFGPFESQNLVLGDPGARDALLHSLQAAVPHRRVVPVSVERIVFQPGGESVTVEAIERSATNDTFVFDIVARDDSGSIVEEWTAAVFRAISDIEIGAVLASQPALVSSYIERMARHALEDPSVEVAVVADPTWLPERRRARALALLELNSQIFKRSDGKPLILSPTFQGHASIAHRNAVTIAVKAARQIGCDVELPSEFVGAQSPEPLPLSARLLATKVASSGPESWASAAARVWALGEVVVKNGLRLEGGFQPHRTNQADIVTFESPSGRTMTLRVSLPLGEFIFAVGIVRFAAETGQASVSARTPHG